MSDTPRTDAELRKPIHDTGIHNNLTEFCRDLERENAELRADNESLVQSNRQLRQSIAVLLGEPVNSL